MLVWLPSVCHACLPGDTVGGREGGEEGDRVTCWNRRRGTKKKKKWTVKFTNRPPEGGSCTIMVRPARSFVSAEGRKEGRRRTKSSASIRSFILKNYLQSCDSCLSVCVRLTSPDQAAQKSDKGWWWGLLPWQPEQVTQMGLTG